MPSAEGQVQRRIPVLIVTSALGIGGAEQIAACLAMGLSRRLFDVAVCYLKEQGAIAEQLAANGVELLSLPGFKPGRRDYTSSLKLRRLVRSRDIKIIHTHDIHSLMDGSVCRALTPGLRFVHTYHFGNYPHRYRHYQLIERATWRVPDRLVAVGYNQAAQINRFYGIPLRRMRVIWNGVDDIVQASDQDPLRVITSSGVPVIGSVSTLIPQKGLDHLLQAAAILRNAGERFQLVIAGGGPLESSLRAKSAELGLRDCVRFLGWVPRASARLLPACDIFVQSSLWEAMSVVVLEAMAAGKPMVVTRVGENARVVLDGDNGLTVPPADPQALADSLQRLLHDHGLRQRLGRSARERYETTFTTQHMISAHEALYQELTCG